MSRMLKIQALACRALSLIGKTGRQAAAAKKQRAGFYREAWREAATILNGACCRYNTPTGPMQSLHTGNPDMPVFTKGSFKVAAESKLIAKYNYAWKHADVRLVSTVKLIPCDIRISSSSIFSWLPWLRHDCLVSGN